MQAARLRAAAAPLLAVAALLGCGSESSGGKGQPSADARAAHERGIAFAEQGDRRAALRELKEAVRLAPEWDEAWSALAVVAARARDNAARFEAFEYFLAKDPDDEASLYGLAEAALDAGAPERAAAALERLDTRAPLHEWSVRLLMLHARLEFELGNVELAGSYATRVARVNPDDADAHYLVGVAAEESDPAKAEERYGLALRADPGHLGARDRLAVLLSFQDRAAEAARHRDLHSRIVEATVPQFRRLDPGQRFRQFATLCEDLPTWVFAYIEKARAEHDLGRAGDALKTLKAALDLAPDTGEVHSLLAEVYSTQGKLQAADRHRQRAAELGAW